MEPRPVQPLPETVGLVAVLPMAWPILVSMLSFTAMIVADSLFVARLGTEPLAALGLATPAIFLLFGFGLGLLRGVKVVVAQRSGAGDHGAVDRLLWQTLWLASGLGLLMALCAPLGRPVFEVMGGSAEVVALAMPYFVVRSLGAPLACLHVGIGAWFEGRGNTRTPMISTLLANGLNIALDPIFIFGLGAIPAMGTGGAALATVLAIGVATAFYAWPLSREAEVDVDRGVDRRLLQAVSAVGTPMGVRTLLEVGAWTAFVSMLARVGAEHLAAHVVVMRVVSVSFLPGHAIGEAGAVFVGQALGARRPELAMQAWRASLRLAVGGMAVCAALFLAVPDAFLAPFGVSGEVLALCRELLVIAAIFQLFDAVTMVGSSVGLGLGAPGAWLALAAELALLGAVFAARIHSGRWLVVGAAMVESQEDLELATAA